MKCRIDSLDDFGRGITRINNKICFVKDAIDGEVIDLEIVNEKKNYLVARVKEYIEKSDKRIKPKCKYYNICGGCNLEHISLKDEEKYKIKKIESILKKFAGINTSIEKITSLNEYNYRNKVTLRVKNGKIGLLEENSHSFIEIDKCYLVVPKINEVIFKLKDIVKEEDGISKIMIRTSNDNHIVMIKIEGKVRNLSNFKSICDSLIVNDKVIKNEFIESAILDKRFYVSSNSFFQINKDIVEAMYKRIIEIIKKKSSYKVLDLYCGVGTIGICVSNYVDQVLGIEVVRESVDSAFKNKELNNVNNISFKCGKVEDIIDAKLMNFDTIIVDPPRAGIEKSAIEVLNNSKAQNIIYVSCDPVTLARDIKNLDNYELKEIELFNMFPRTYHCESIAVLERK
ncbi:MAG: class I SAM-dependent RNA methyltransferase [Bacilli bacterium]|nr:class I SAM-dependent RNA methyltransferase [Bacilli bacterium]